MSNLSAAERIVRAIEQVEIYRRRLASYEAHTGTGYGEVQVARAELVRCVTEALEQLKKEGVCG